MIDEIKTTSDPKLDTPFPRHRLYYLILKIAVLAIAAVPTAEATTVLRRALDDTDPVVRGRAALALGSRQVGEAIPVLLAMVVFKGFLSRIAIIVGAAIGIVFSAIRGEWSVPLEAHGGKTATEVIADADWFGFPTFNTPRFDGSVLMAFVPVVIILIAENIGHLKSVSAMTGRNLDPETGRALLADGLATTVAGLGGGSGTTTYAENIGVMAATRVYSTLAYWAAAVFALVLSLCPKFGALVAVLPVGVLGGLATLLFGLIAVLGARIWVEAKVDFKQPINLVTAAVALIVGTADYTAHLGSMLFNGIALGTIAALVIYHGLGWIARLRGGAVETPATPAFIEGDES